MNSDNTTTALKIIVERAVRPVQASLARKKRMREELLAHVTEAFDEEIAASHDKAIAVANTAKRFGDPDTVAAQLQQTVPPRDRMIQSLERITQERLGESAVVHALRWSALVSAANVAPVAAFLIPAALFFEPDNPEQPVVWRLLAAVAVASAILTFLYVLLSNQLDRALFRSEKRSIARAAICGLLSLFGPAIVAVLIELALSGDLRTAVEFSLVPGPILLVVPILLLVATWRFGQERHYLHEWASLSID